MILSCILHNRKPASALPVIFVSRVPKHCTESAGGIKPKMAQLIFPLSELDLAYLSVITVCEIGVSVSDNAGKIQRDYIHMKTVWFVPLQFAYAFTL